jgi:hypothetical protein
MAISKYTKPLDQTLEQYVPLPFEEMMQAGKAIQQRGDQAEAQNAAVETGLGSMEAMAQGQSKFRDTFVQDYRSNATALLDKFKGNTSDPDFIRESRKLNLTYAADPRLQTIKQTNEFLKSQEKIKMELGAKGIKYIDPNRNFSGVDDKGNLVAPQAGVRGTNFDEDITKAFLQIKDNMTDNGRGWKTNKPNLDNLAGNFVKNLDSHPATRDAIDYYKQQGMSDTQAKQAALGLVKQAYTDNLKSDRDYSYDQMLISRENLNLSKRKQAMDEYEFKAKLQAKKTQNTGLIASQGTIDPKDINSTLISKVDDVLGQVTKAGGIPVGRIQTIADTPENRQKYAGKFDVVNKASTNTSGTGAGQMLSIGSQLRIKDQYAKATYNPEQQQLVRVAREQLGSLAKNGDKYLSDKTVLERYKQHLANDNVAATFWTTPRGDQLKALDNTYVGSHGEKLGDAVVIDENGKHLRTTDKSFDMSKYEGFSFSGFSAVPNSDFPEGAIKVSAVDKKSGKIVQFLKPMDPSVSQQFNVSNKGYKAMMSGKMNDEIARDPQYRLQSGSDILVPQKMPGGGLNLFYIDRNGKRLNREPVNFGDYVNAERQEFSTNYLDQFSNKE